MSWDIVKSILKDIGSYFYSEVMPGIIAVIVLVGFLILVCSGISSCDKERRETEYQKTAWRNSPFVSNNIKVTVIGIYSEHNHKGHFSGHSAVVEGINTKERKQLCLRGKLPVVGEIWTVTLNDEGNIVFDEISK